MQNKLSKNSKILLVLSSIILIISIFVPLWRIELDAPQYPEGLVMKIFSYKLGGQVEIINGLNHYIGMQTLHAENFIEFTLLPYIISFFALLALVTAFYGSKRMLYITFGLFLAFGIIAMADFWRWEYNYGHNLDPSAAIIVPVRFLISVGGFLLQVGYLCWYLYFLKQVIYRSFLRKKQP